jgi:hypothetical protein
MRGEQEKTGEQTGEENGVDVAALWTQSAARVKYAVHNGLPLIGVSGTAGDGFIVSLPAPAWFAAVPTEGERDNVFRAMAAHALRVGQAKLKASKTPTREDATAGANSVFDGTYKPQREVVNDIVDDEAKRLFADHIRTLVLTKNPAATESVIADTVTKYGDADSGKAWIEAARGRVLESMTYVVNRKGEKSGGALEIEL